MIQINGCMGFALQEQRGEFCAPVTWLPLLPTEDADGSSVEWCREINVFDDRRGYQTRHYASAGWAEGAVTVPIIPGVVCNLLSWLQDRDVNRQGKVASVVIDKPGQYLRLADVKIAKAVFHFRRPSPVYCVLDLLGGKRCDGPQASPAMPIADPYNFEEAEIEIAGVGGTAEVCPVSTLLVQIDNTVIHPTENRMMGNMRSVRCEGKLQGEPGWGAEDIEVGTEGAVLLHMNRGCSSLGIVFPRALFKRKGVQNNRIWAEFRGLGSVDGVAPPIVLA